MERMGVVRLGMVKRGLVYWLGRARPGALRLGTEARSGGVRRVVVVLGAARLGKVLWYGVDWIEKVWCCLVRYFGVVSCGQDWTGLARFSIMAWL